MRDEERLRNGARVLWLDDGPCWQGCTGQLRSRFLCWLYTPGTRGRSADRSLGLAEGVGLRNKKVAFSNSAPTQRDDTAWPSHRLPEQTRRLNGTKVSSPRNDFARERTCNPLNRSSIPPDGNTRANHRSRLRPSYSPSGVAGYAPVTF